MRKPLITLGAFLLAAPVLLLAGCLPTPDRPALWLLPLALALLLALAARYVPAKARALSAFLAAFQGGGAALLLGHALHAWPKSLMPAVLTFAAALAHAWLLALPREETPPTLWYMGLIAYGAARFIGAASGLAALPGPLRIFALLYAVYILFALAFQSLWEGMGGGRGPSRQMLLRNGALAGLMAAVLLIGTHIPQLGQALKSALTAIARAIAWLSNLLTPASSTGAPSAGNGPGMAGMMGETGEPALIWVILEKIGLALCAVFIVLLAAGFVYLVFRALIRAVRRLIAGLRAYAGTLNDAYEDTVESLIDWGEARRALRPGKRSRRAPKPAWDTLDARRKVRRSYQIFLRRHPDLPADSTARRALPDSRLAALYESARYSREPVTPQDAEEGRRMERL